MYTHLEDHIENLFNELSIHNPSQLNIDTVSEKFDVFVCYGNINFRFGDTIMIERSTRQNEWINFAHELCHYLYHEGNQLDMYWQFRDLQEYQADYFTYHFCIPTFMLEELKPVSVYDVTSLFNVDHDFAFRRLELYQNKYLSGEAVSSGF